VIDNCPPIQTVTERLVLHIIVRFIEFLYNAFMHSFLQKSRKPTWYTVYKSQPVLTHTKTPIKAPLLALPYGKPELSLTKSLEYGSLHQEAVKVFNVLLRLDEVRNPIPAVQVILSV